MSQLEARQIGERLQLARKEAGLTQEQVTEVADVSRRSLQDYENGVTIPYKHLRQFAAIYERDVEWFLHGDQDADAVSGRLLGEVAASVQQLTEAMQDAIQRLSRIEAQLERHEGEHKAPARR